MESNCPFMYELRQCEDEEDFSYLMMESVSGEYNDSAIHKDHKLIAVVDHLGSYDISQIMNFFEKIYADLRVPFWIGDGTSLIIDGKRFHRSFLYSNEDPLINTISPDALYRLQEPLIEHLDGIIIGLKELNICFKKEGELIKLDSIEETNKAIRKLLTEYWTEGDHPEIIIRDSLSGYDRTKWLVESVSCQLMAMDSREDAISLVGRIVEFIPGLNPDFQPEDYIPFVAALKIATAMNPMESQAQDEIIRRLILCFGFFDDFLPPEDLL